MKAQHRFGLSLSWPRVTTVFLVDIVILLVASHCPASWQGDHHIAFSVGVGLAALITLFSLVTSHGLTATSGLGRWLWDWSSDPGAALGSGCTPGLDHQRRFGRDKVGVREHDGHLVTVIEVDGGEEDSLGRHRHRTTSANLPVHAVADGLRQFDIHLDSIEIVSTKVRSRGNAAEKSKL